MQMRFRKGEITQKQNAVNHILKTIILVLIIPQMRIINNMWKGGMQCNFRMKSMKQSEISMK